MGWRGGYDMRVNIPHSKFLRHCRIDSHGSLFPSPWCKRVRAVILSSVDPRKNRSYILSLSRILALAHARRGFTSCSEAFVACSMFLQFLTGLLLPRLILSCFPSYLMQIPEYCVKIKTRNNESFQIRYILLATLIHSFDAKYYHSFNKRDTKQLFFLVFPSSPGNFREHIY
jgi:hypothetical protein